MKKIILTTFFAVFIIRCTIQKPLVQQRDAPKAIQFIDEFERAARDDSPLLTPIDFNAMLARMEDYCDAGIRLPVYENLDQLEEDADRAMNLDSTLFYFPQSRGEYGRAIVGGEFLFRFLVAAQHRLYDYYSPKEGPESVQTAVSSDGAYLFHYKQRVSDMLPVVQMHEKYAAARTRLLFDLIGIYPHLKNETLKERYWVAVDRMLGEIALNKSETDYLMFQRRADGLLIRPSKILAQLKTFSQNEKSSLIQQQASTVISGARARLAAELGREEKELISTVELNRRYMERELADRTSLPHSRLQRRSKWFSLAFEADDPLIKIDYYSRAIAADSFYAPAYNNRGNALQSRGDYAAALHDFDRAIDLDSTFAMAYKNRGALYFLLNDNKAALRDLSRAIHLDRACVACYADRGKVLIGESKFVDALADFETALQLNPGNADLLNYRGVCRQKLGNPGAAMADFNVALEIDPTCLPALINRGSAFRRLGDDVSAIRDYTLALQIQPDNILALNNRAICFKNIREFDRAIADHRKALAINPNDAVAFYNLGCVYWELKNWPAVIDAWEKCLQLDPEHQTARKWLPLARNEQSKRRWR